MKVFIKEFAEKNGMDISDFMRLIVEYYMMAFFCKQGSYRDIRRKFFDLYPDHDPKTAKNSKIKGKK